LFNGYNILQQTTKDSVEEVEVMEEEEEEEVVREDLI
jgi:hypothetical protein